MSTVSSWMRVARCSSSTAAAIDDGVGGIVGVKLGGQQGERRTYPLAAAVQNMVQKLVHVGNVGTTEAVESPFYLLKLGLDGCVNVTGRFI